MDGKAKPRIKNNSCRPEEVIFGDEVKQLESHWETSQVADDTNYAFPWYNNFYLGNTSWKKMNPLRMMFVNDPFPEYDLWSSRKFWPPSAATSKFRTSANRSCKKLNFPVETNPWPFYSRWIPVKEILSHSFFQISWASAQLFSSNIWKLRGDLSNPTSLIWNTP